MATPQYACTAPPGFVLDNSDCDDTRNDVYPNAVELCDYLDNDCNGLVDESVATEYFFDADGDGYGNMYSPIPACTQPPGTITMGGDCNDSDPAIHLGATELENGIDDNCTGGIDEGFETQRIRFVRDVPNDQGRAVRVRFRRHLREIIPGNYPDAIFANYILYRRVEPGQSLVARARPEGALAVNLPPGEWDIAAAIFATGDTTYQVVVPTLCDSNAAGTCRSTFFVRARWEEQEHIFTEDSAPDSGYSVDNIAPGVPVVCGPDAARGTSCHGPRRSRPTSSTSASTVRPTLCSCRAPRTSCTARWVRGGPIPLTASSRTGSRSWTRTATRAFPRLRRRRWGWAAPRWRPCCRSRPWRPTRSARRWRWRSTCRARAWSN
jgi:hypothetical protein